jgi:hypothetical protein
MLMSPAGGSEEMQQVWRRIRGELDSENMTMPSNLTIF